MQNHTDYKVVEVITDVYSFAIVPNVSRFKESEIYRTSICYNVDSDLVYEPFYADFGPLNFGQAYKYFNYTKTLLKEALRRKCRLCLFTGPERTHMANSAVLVGMFQVLGLNRTAQQAWEILAPLGKFLPFRDASWGTPVFDLTVKDCIDGIARARDCGIVDWQSTDTEQEMKEYTAYERVENGDMTWILPGKLMAFSGPAQTSRVFNHFRTRTPEDYWDYFKSKGISTVVRLNAQVYEPKQFTAGGFKLEELYFPDGTCPSHEILQKFLLLAENEPGALAIHCKAGLGRTGCLICSYLIKHFRFTAQEAIGYIRVMRPGSVIASQQLWLLAVAPQLQQQGDLYRSRLTGPSRPVRGKGLPTHSCEESGDSTSTTCTKDDAAWPRTREAHSLPGAAASQAEAGPCSQDFSEDLQLERVRALLSTPAPLAEAKGPSKVQRLSAFLRTASAKSILVSTPASVAVAIRRRSVVSRPAAEGSARETQQEKCSDALLLKDIDWSLSPTSVARCLAPNGQPRKMPAGLNASEKQLLVADEEVDENSKKTWLIGARSRS
eukprot:jgi/Botrbrau1/10309/Bobra.0120s0022.1